MAIRQRFAKYFAYQRTVRELSALDNDRLRDLGINRGQIRAIARAHAL